MKNTKKLLGLLISVIILSFGTAVNADTAIDVSSYDYVIDNMTFWTGSTQVDTLEEASSAAIDVTKRTLGTGQDKLIVAMYSDTQALIGMHTLEHTIEYGETSTLKIYMYVPNEVTIGEVKAFVWNGLTEGTSLSNSLSSKNNQIIDPNLEGADRKVTFSLSDIDNEDYKRADGSFDSFSFDGEYLRFYESDTAVSSTKYYLYQNYTTLYVNGVKVSAETTDIFNYVVMGGVGDVTLVDTYRCDGKYDTIYVSYYAASVVDTCVSSKIYMSYASAGFACINLDNGGESHIYYNGSEIKISDLMEGDVLSIAYDVTAGFTMADAIKNSSFYNIYVSRKTLSGILTAISDEGEIRLDYGEFYAVIPEFDYRSFYEAVSLGDEVKLYLDQFDRIAYYELIIN